MTLTVFAGAAFADDPAIDPSTPANATHCPGDTASFTVAATSAGNLTYQWSTNGTPLTDSDKYSGSQSATLFITNVTVADALTYTVAVTTDFGGGNTTNVSATLTVNPTTDAGAGMANQTNCVGANITFTSTVTGASLTYVWRRDGTLLAGETSSSFTTNNAGTTASGTYCVEVTGACGSATNCATLTVNAPTSATALTSLTNCPGTSATFSTTASGTGPFSYVWRFNGNELVGETASSFTTNNVSAASAGTYTVEVTGACGSATNSATLTVLTNVSATALTSLTNCPGTSATFSTTASGTGPFSYVWRFNGNELVGETASSFTTNNVSAASAGTYTVEVSGACGSVTNSATLTVNAPTLAGAGMASQTVCEGASVTFTSSATGTGLTYVWVKDGVELVGETGSSFTTNGVSVASSGEYWVQVTGACGQPVTNSADLTVRATTAAGAGMADQTKCPGGSATFTSTVTGTSLTYVWRFNGNALTGATASSFTTNNVGAASAGTYTVEVTGACGSATNSAVLTVLTNVSATALTSLTNCPGTSATFSTTASGTGPFSYVWRFNGNELVGETGSSLTTNSVSAASAGTYTVEVAGACGSVTNSADLTVNAPTLAGVGMASQTVCEGASVTFTSSATGTGLTYVWVKDGFVLDGETGSSLTTNGVSVASSGEYWVQVTGACGSVTNSADLTVNPTTAAGAGMADQTNCAGANITFTSMVTGTSLTYVWRFNGNELVGETGSSFTTNNVSAGSAGTYTVEVTGACGNATNSATLTIGTAVTATPLVNTTVCPGAAASFSTLASGTGPFTYQWYTNGVPVGDVGEFSGSTTDTLTINPATVADAMTYSVLVGGMCGSAINSATLTVSAVASATALTSLARCPGGSATFSTTAGGAGPFSYVWKKDGNVLAGVTGSSFTTNNVSAASAGTYTVEVTGPCNSVTNSATLTVSVTSATALTGLTNCPGTSVTFSTVASGTGPFSYVWKKDGNVLTGVTGSSFTTNNVSAANVGTYTVEVTSSCGSVTNSAVLALSTAVNAAALTSLTNCPGSSATFSTTAIGGGPFSYVWRKDGIVQAGATGSSFTTNNVSAASAGTYTVEVHSPCGDVTNSATLTVVNDSAPPIIFCVPDKAVECASAWSFDSPTALDAFCGTNVTVTILSTVTNGDSCSQVIVRTWTATDCCNNSATCSQTVTVVDTTPPVFGSSVTNILADGGTNDNFVGPEPSFPSAGLITWLTNHSINVFKGFDNCTNNRTFAHTFTNLPACISKARLLARLRPCSDNPDNDTIELAFTDATGEKMANWRRFLGTSGNESNPVELGLLPGNWWSHGAGYVFVLDLSALPLAGGGTTNMLPYLNHMRLLDILVRDDSSVDYLILELTISCGAPDKTVECSSGWSFDTPVSVDACAGNNVTTTMISTLTNSSACQTIVTLTWEISDPCSNKTSCSQRVTVVDTTPPLAIGAAGKTVECGSVWDFDPPLTLDSCCGANLTVSVLGTVTNGGCPQSITRTWQATDCCSNSATCSQTVTVVNDTTPPDITCATNKTVECGTAWTFDLPIVSDTCGGTNVTITVISTVTNGSCPATITRTWQAMDSCSNISVQCSQIVTVVDTTPPVIVCPTNIIADACTNIAVCFAVTATDSCNSVTVVYTPASCSEFAFGTVTPVHCVATDACGNSSSCDFTVEVAGPKLTIELIGDDVVISWAGDGILQEADSLSDTWTSLPGVTSPYTVPQPLAAMKRYRLECN